MRVRVGCVDRLRRQHVQPADALDLSSDTLSDVRMLRLSKRDVVVEP